MRNGNAFQLVRHGEPITTEIDFDMDYETNIPWIEAI